MSLYFSDTWRSICTLKMCHRCLLITQMKKETTAFHTLFKVWLRYHFFQEAFPSHPSLSPQALYSHHSTYAYHL